MRLLAATLAAALIVGLSSSLLWWADEARDAAAVAGATGLVLAGALLGLTLFAWRWRSGTRAYADTRVDTAGFYEELASAFDETTEGYDDSPAMRAAR